MTRTPYTPPLGVPAARKVVCHSDWKTPHGEGHNRVCVCQCQWCRQERGMLGAVSSVVAQLSLFAEAA